MRLPRFDKALYQREMERLLRGACNALSSEHPGVIVYSASVWTDPDAAVSAVSFDTRDNSDAAVARLKGWAQDNHPRLIAAGLPDSAAAVLRTPSRNSNPADFVVRDIAEVRHRSFARGWAQRTDGQCWDLLDEALDSVAATARVLFADLPLDEDAQLGINTRDDWFGRVWPLRAGAT